MRALVRVESLAANDFLLDDDELARLQRLRVHAIDLDPGLPRAPALADLQLSLGPSAPAQFLWEEVLNGLDPRRLADLTRISVPNQVDDAIVQDLIDGRWTAEALLVERGDLVAATALLARTPDRDRVVERLARCA